MPEEKSFVGRKVIFIAIGVIVCIGVLVRITSG